MGKTIRINGVDVPVIDDMLSGRDIKRTAGLPQERVLDRQDDDRNVIVPDDQRIRVADQQQFTHHARHSKAMTSLDPRRLRIRHEAAQLAYAYPGLTVADDESWLHIPEFRLPPHWEPDRTTVLIVPPATYPETAPDGFFLGDHLRRRDGRALVQPAHYFSAYKNRYAELGYRWYCLEDPERNWDPRFDSLVSYVEAIRTYLGTVD
ncbi:E2/UBC family protein [Micromonospora sp. LOL_021]|uniref:E2/UBC family protein n=1 Tax=Micromonospora sp. LOL_021 TaxID=3345417 RepID=UPI003A84FB56